MMNNESNDLEINQLKREIINLKKTIDFLNRENNRRKSEIQQLTAALRRG